MSRSIARVLTKRIGAAPPSRTLSSTLYKQASIPLFSTRSQLQTITPALLNTPRINTLTQRHFSSSSNRMTLSVGSEVPNTKSLWEEKPENVVELPTSGKYILVGVPGAFTPPCSDHVPGYLSNYEAFAAKGYKDIYVVCVNDIFVVNAWKKQLSEANPDHKVHFLSDRSGDFINATGLSFDAAGLLGNVRSRRFAAIVEDGKVKDLKVEVNPPDIEGTKAENLLKGL
ncbi:Redoxin-domain-containing protein [Ascobolus immersus RN42]|uniref:Redoxin-domain-containing protein n=1 Tax=Ascobolus immersus RN42 TaxID=1160509 RepID=A0A3N4INA6_ASCIM|nr:Redoxin-domain-containing protein [Ascobolus immersus RN42]